MTEGRRRSRRGAVVLLLAMLPVAGCIDDSSAPPEPQASAPLSPTPQIRLGDVSVGSSALAESAGLYICGDTIVASAPAGGIPGNSFVVFDADTGAGEITEVELPQGMRPNARWLLTTQCVDSERTAGPPFLSVAYQEMPLAPGGSGRGIRAAYSLEGEQLWMRRDLNQPALVVDDVLVVGPSAEQPESAVDLRTGETVATFDPAVQTRTVVSGNRMVVRPLTGPPVLTTLTGERIATLREATSFSADGDLLFASTPAALPDADQDGEPDAQEDPDGLTDASPSPSPTPSASPPPGSGLFQGKVAAYSLRTGRLGWRLAVAPDPLGVPTVGPATGVVVVVDVAGAAHGIDPDSGRRMWQTPTELDNPRVSAASGVVLFDKRDEPEQVLLDARSGHRLAEQEEPIVDLDEVGALQIIDGVPRLVPTARLRRPASEGPVSLDSLIS
jgi:hypothetical protein